jgi:hypothetical protein
MTDLASYIEARRRARGEPTQSQEESETERRNRIVAGNLASAQIGGELEPKGGGGIFTLKRMGYDDAEFYFNGWSDDLRHRAHQLVEVRKGNNPDIQIAVVRKMIAIIREQVQGDFHWHSERTGHSVVKSARPEDNEELEAFLMDEFFGGTEKPRPR